MWSLKKNVGTTYNIGIFACFDLFICSVIVYWKSVHLSKNNYGFLQLVCYFFCQYNNFVLNILLAEIWEDNNITKGEQPEDQTGFLQTSRLPKLNWKGEQRQTVHLLPDYPKHSSQFTDIWLYFDLLYLPVQRGTLWVHLNFSFTSKESGLDNLGNQVQLENKV